MKTTNITVSDIKSTLRRIKEDKNNKNKDTLWRDLMIYYGQAKDLISFDLLKKDLYGKVDSEDNKIYIQKLTCDIRRAVKLNINLDGETGRNKLFELCKKAEITNRSKESFDQILSLLSDLDNYYLSKLKDRINEMNNN